MAVSPLEALMSVQHRLNCTMDPQRQESAHSSPAPRLKTRQGQSSSVPLLRAQRSQHSPENAARERSRVRNLRQAFHSLQAALPSVPPDTKLSKLDVLLLATNYIGYLTETLDREGTQLPSRSGGSFHPVKKWPMRSLLFCGSVGDLLSQDAPGAPALEADKE
ncbi:transcription factor 23-like [Eucyclogobius newberryi]|uniref:transcription factor 23-like n=1 Tax=Eucyclogobius newberryi TaxID=166745 RepID=UPI003B5BCB84